jgi:hypothetical protein
MGKSNYFSSKSVFGQLISLIDDKKIKDAVKKLDSDRYVKRFNPNYAFEILRDKSIGKSHSPTNHFLRFFVSAILSLSVSPTFSEYAPIAKVLYLNVDNVFCVFS